jgi:hypothetical protein
MRWICGLAVALIAAGLALPLFLPANVLAEVLRPRGGMHVVWAAQDGGDGLLSTDGQPASATSKALSTNFSLTNMANGVNTAIISYFKPDGSIWRTSETQTFTQLGETVIFRQYTDPMLTAGEGSIVIESQAPVDSVVQIRALNQTPTSAAYTAVARVTDRGYLPVVLKESEFAFSPVGTASHSPGSTALFMPSVSRLPIPLGARANSQIIVQNADTESLSFTINLVSGPGTIVYSTPPRNLPPGGSFRYDLTDDEAAPAGQFSAVVEAAEGRGIAVMSNVLIGADALLSYTAAEAGRTSWYFPFFFARLANGQNTAIAVQNTTTSPIPAGALSIDCRPAEGSSVGIGVNWSNAKAVAGLATFGVDSIYDLNIPAGFVGTCKVTSSSPVHAVAFLRNSQNAEAAAYEGIDAATTSRTVVMPLFLRRLSNGFATVGAFQNLGSQPANIRLEYRKSAEAPPFVNCDVSINFVIPVGGVLIQNHRVPNGAGNSTPWVDENCTGLIVATADQPIGGVTLITTINAQPGDTMMAHRMFQAP